MGKSTIKGYDINGTFHGHVSLPEGILHYIASALYKSCPLQIVISHEISQMATLFHYNNIWINGIAMESLTLAKFSMIHIPAEKAPLSTIYYQRSSSRYKLLYPSI